MPNLEMKGITKIYPNGVIANDRVDFCAKTGEVHALVGENGAGKTTLMKILYGMERPTEGEILLDNELVQIDNPLIAINHSIGMVHQHFMLIDSFSVAENIVLNIEPGSVCRTDRKKAIEIAVKLSKENGLTIDPNARTDTTSVGIRQRIEILKTLHRGAKILILDEPSAILTPQETTQLFNAIRDMSQHGMTVIFITHKLREVKEISDNITVLRSGHIVGSMKTSEVSEKEIAKMMVGREVFFQINKPPLVQGPPILEVTGMECVGNNGLQALHNVTFNVYSGEILCVAGVEGNGQTELVEGLTGLRRVTRGRVVVCGTDITNLPPRKIREVGVSHIPEDRLGNGLAITESIAENIVIDRYYRPPIGKIFWINTKKVYELGKKLLIDFGILAPNPTVLISQLSGGNMQKVVLARELSSNPKLIIASQPTRGIDIGNSEYVQKKIIDQRTNGCGILLVSADINEVMNLADRIAVFYNGEIVAILDNSKELTDQELGMYMMGVKKMNLSKVGRAN